MLNIIQNTIGAIRRVGESVVRAGLKMWLPFTKAEPLGKDLIVDGDFPENTTAWSFSGGATLEENGAKISNEASSGSDIAVAIQVLPLTVSQLTGKVFELTYDVIATNGETLAIQQSSNVLLDTATVGVNRKVTFTWDFGFNDIRIKRHTAGVITNVTIDNVSLKELTQETPDISGNDNNAILKTGKCLTFTGNDSVQTAFPSSKDIKTIAFWIYPTHSSTDEVVFYFGDAAGGDKYIDLDHLVMESDANNNINFDVYIDGVLRGETNYGGNNPTLTINQWQRVVLTTDTAINTTNDKFYIAHKENGAFGRFNMSDLQIYGAEFTADDIAYDYANPQKLVTDNASSNVTLNDLHAWWHMSEGDGTIAFDSAPLIGKEFFSNYNFSQGLDTWEKVGATSENVLSLLNGNLVYTPLNSDYTFNKFKNTTAIYEANKTYRIEYKIIENTGLSNLKYFHGNGYSDAPFSVGTHIINFTTGSVSTTELYFWNTTPSSTQSITFEYISAKEVFNIDGETYDGSSLGANYDDAQERIPQLGMMNWSKGSNLLEYSEDFSQYYKGINTTLTANFSTSPDGTNTATRLQTTASSNTYLSLAASTNIGESYTLSLYVKNNGGQSLDIGYGTSLNTGVEAGQLIINPTNEWVRYSSVFTSTANTNYFFIDNVNNSQAIDCLIWGFQLEESSSATAYRRTDGTAVTDATLISCATDSQKDILGNAVRVKGSGFNLDGTGYAEVLDSNDFDIQLNDAFSMDGWVKWNYVYEGGSSLNTIYSNGLTSTSVNNFSINSRVLGDGTKVMNAWVYGRQINSTTTYTEGEWVYFALTRAAGGGNDTCTLYTSKIDSNGDWVVTSEGTISNSESNGSIGNTGNKTIGWDGTNGDRHYTERIDDIKFYNIELSSDEIEQNFNATKSGHNN